MKLRVPPVQAVTAITAVEVEGELCLALEGFLGARLSGSALQEQLLGAPLLPGRLGSSSPVVLEGVGPFPESSVCHGLKQWFV